MFEPSNRIQNQTLEFSNEAGSVCNPDDMPYATTHTVYIKSEENIKDEPTQFDEFHEDDIYNSDNESYSVQLSVKSSCNLDVSPFLQSTISENPTEAIEVSESNHSDFNKIRSSKLEVTSSNKSYECHICIASFTQIGNLKRHINAIHIGEKKFKCLVCLNRYTTKNSLEYHMKSHTGEKPFKCTQCYYSCKTSKALRYHCARRKHNLPESELKVQQGFCYCSICKKNFTNQHYLKCHMLIHGNPFKCSICGVIFASEENLKQHMKTHIREELFIKSALDSTNLHVTRMQSNHNDDIEENSTTGKFIKAEELCNFGNKSNNSQLSVNVVDGTDVTPQLQGNKTEIILSEYNNKSAISEETVKVHVSPKPSIDKPFNCYICPVSVISVINLKQHINNVHSGEKKIECEICHKRYKKRASLEYHMKSHTGEKPFKCIQCYYSCKTSKALRYHCARRKHNLPESELKVQQGFCYCSICKKNFTNQHHLKRHMLIHGNPFNCSICGEIFALEENLKQHMQTHIREELVIKSALDATNLHVTRMQSNHNGEIEATCKFIKAEELCSFGNKSNNSQLSVKVLDGTDATPQLEGNKTETILSEHVSPKPSIDKPFKCHICSVSVISAKNLKRHINSVHSDEKKFECQICHKRYTTRSYLEYHMKSHTGEKPFKCTECNFCTKKRSTLKLHCWRQHNVFDGEQNNCSCSICGKDFPNQLYLKYHKLVHEKPYKCSTCGMNFSKNQNLKRHMITHTGEKPFKCHLCHKPYAAKKSLEYHLKCHAGDKRFKCAECEYASITQKQLKLHILRTHYKNYQSKVESSSFKCNICNVLFILKNNLEDHIMTHFDQKDSKCSICLKQYAQEKDFQDHVISHGIVKPIKCAQNIPEYPATTAIKAEDIDIDESSNWNAIQSSENEIEIPKIFPSSSTNLETMKIQPSYNIKAEKDPTGSTFTELNEIQNFNSAKIPENIQAISQVQAHSYENWLPKCYVKLVHLPENIKSTDVVKVSEFNQLDLHKTMNKLSVKLSINKPIKLQLNHDGERGKDFTKTDENESNSLQFSSRMPDNTDVAPQLEGNSSENELPKCHIQLVRLPENITSTEVVKVSKLNYLDSINTLHKTMLTKNLSNKHLIIDGNDKLLKCDICAASFSCAKNIKRHTKRVHGVKRNYKCNLCHKRYTSRASLDYHLQLHTEQKPFKCTKCNYSCRKSSSLKSHYWNKHKISDRTSNYCCAVCGKTFPYKHYLKRHILSHLKPFKCITCGMSFSVEPNLRRHMITHTGEKPFECHLCHKRFTAKASLEYHLKSHSRKKSFKCTQCECVYRTQRLLKKHLKKHDENQFGLENKSNIPEQPTVFIRTEDADVNETNNKSSIYLLENESEIPKTFLPASTNLEAMKMQQNYDGESEKDFTKTDELYSCCNESNNLQSSAKMPDNIDVASQLESNSGENWLPKCYVQLFRLPENITSTEVVKVSELNHLDAINTPHRLLDDTSVHGGERNHKCHLCHKRYKSKSSLDYHMKAHIGQKPFNCTECNYACRKNSALNNHYWNKHNIAKAKTGNHCCSICDQNFPYEHYLKRHMLYHLKPFKCSTCGMSFSIESNLKRHVITHTGEKPFECNLCHKCFTSKASLEYHLKTHTGEKPFKCTQCEYACKTQKELKRHFKIHDKNQSKVESKPSEKRDLEDHILADHNNQKNFKCSVCLEQYTQETDLQDHLKSHSIDKLIKCEENVPKYTTTFIKSNVKCCTEPLKLEENIKVESPYLNYKSENSDNTEHVEDLNLEAICSKITDSFS